MSSPASELKSELVRAGAGAGKTRGLVNTVVEVFRHFQARGEQPRIVLTTFTRKATQELKERLILRACSDRDAALLQFVSDPGRLQISTIHGLLNLFLRQVGHLAGIDAGFQLISEAEGDHLARQVLRDVLVEHPEGLRWLETYGFDRVLQMCRRFDGAARGAAYMGESPGLEPAGMEDLQAAADRVIASWRERLRQLVHEFEAGTDDRGWLSFAAGINDFVARWSGDGAELGELPTKPRRSKKCEHLEPLHERYDDVVKEFKTEMGRTCWNRNLWPDMVASWREFAGLGRAFAHKMATLKEGQARFEMEDLELKSMEVLRAQPFLGSVFAANWDFWMIDEYQDTSPLQVACLKALMAAQPRYFVGDPQQSIYLFRGAEVSVFSATEEELKASGAAIRELRRNYRSEPDLLLWINDFMSSLGAGFAHMDPREDPAPPTRSCVTFFKAEDADQELKAIVTRVQELVRNGVGLERICVLGRTHRNLVEVSRALRNFGYPTHVHAARGFGQRREVLDARALWKFLVNPHDNSNLIQLLRSPWFFIEDYRIEEWMADKPRSLWCKLLSIEESTDSVIRLCRAQDQVAQLGLVRAFEESLCAAAYVDLSLVNDPAGRKESNLWKLILRAHTLEKDGGSVLDLLEDDGSDPMDSQEGDAASAQEPNCINLMTIHGSKGLEFDHVILPRMGESPRTSHTPPLETDGGRFFFPVWDKGKNEFVSSLLGHLNLRHQQRRELAEFDRWLYVALTRAKVSLTLTWSTVGRDSWASRSSWFQLEPGAHVRDHYGFEVRCEWPEPEPYHLRTEEGREVRSRWRESAAIPENRRSVTGMLTASAASTRVEEVIRRWQAQNRGVGIHKALEALKYRNTWEGLETEEFREALEYVASLQSPPLRELITQGEVEWGFQIKTRKGVIQGQIDLWGKREDQLYVVDYKSGSPDHAETAFAQLSLYAWALRKFGHHDPIQLVVVYPLLRKTEMRDFGGDSFARWELEFSGA